MKKTLHTKLQTVFILFLIFLSIWVLSDSLKGFAQGIASNQSLEVSPASQEIPTDPGATIKIKATITNKSSATVPINVRIEDFTASGEEGQVALVEKSPYSLTTWTTVNPSSFELKAGERKDVFASVSVPQNAAGGRYASFIFSIVPKGQETGSAANVGQEIGSLFLVRISGPVTEQLALDEFSAPNFSEYGPITFKLKFRNSGNIHVKTAGIVNVTDMFNGKTADIVVKPTNVFPQADRVVQATLPNKFLFGRYTATAIMYFGTKNEALNATTIFYVVPIKLLAIVIIILFLLYTARRRLSKAFKVLFSGK